MSAENQSIPTPALILGFGGLIPFFTAALLVWLQPDINSGLPTWIVSPNANSAQLATLALGTYGAVILSFLGGVRWGNLLFDENNLKRWMPLTLSVLPSLIAWPALLLSPVPQLALLSAGFTLQYALDVKAGKRNEIPAWFLRLRLILTSGAITSLLIGLLGNVH
ncbi:MAG: DUF3429 domain-containing protein [Granulosicoccus sp.]